MISNSLARQTNALARSLAISAAAPTGLAELKGEYVRLSYAGTAYTGLVIRTGYQRQGNRVLGFWLVLRAAGKEISMEWDKVTNVVATEVSLPACTGFVGTGQRCGTCRVHRNTHA